MAIFEKKFKKKAVAEQSQFEKDQAKYADRQPNHWSYSDDPLINMDPVFSDDPLAPQDPFKEFQTASASNSDTNGDVGGIQAIIAKHRANNPRAPKVNGALGDIINKARATSSDIQKDVAERDPVIAKLQKIEELRRTGGTDADLYTDVSKSNSTRYYADRAKEFHDANAPKKIETALERALRLSAEAQEKREFSRTNGLDIPGDQPTSLLDLKKAQMEKFQANDGGVNIYKTRAIQHMEDATAEWEEKKSVFHQASINQGKIKEEPKTKKTKGSSKVQKPIVQPNNNPKIAALESKIKARIAKLEKHKNDLAKKEAKVNELLLETVALMDDTEREKKLIMQERELAERERKIMMKERELNETQVYIESSTIYNKEGLKSMENKDLIKAIQPEQKIVKDKILSSTDSVDYTESAKQRVSDIKKSDELIRNNSLEVQMIIPRKKQESYVEPTHDIIRPSGKSREQFGDQKEQELIKPRKKREQNFAASNFEKDEFEKTFNNVKSDINTKYKAFERDEKRLIKEQKRIESKVLKTENKLRKIVAKGSYDSSDIEKTLEIKSNYVSAMQEINENIQKVNSNYEGLSLNDRRKQIYANANSAATERAQKLMYIRDKEAKGEGFKKSAHQAQTSHYHQQLNNAQSDYFKARNPFYERLKAINERGGVTEQIEAPIDMDRVTKRWHDKAYKKNKNGRQTPNGSDYIEGWKDDK